MDYVLLVFRLVFNGSLILNNTKLFFNNFDGSLFVVSGYTPSRQDFVHGLLVPYRVHLVSGTDGYSHTDGVG